VSARAGSAGSSRKLSRLPRSSSSDRRIRSTAAAASHRRPRSRYFAAPMASLTRASRSRCSSGRPRFASPAAMISASGSSPWTMRALEILSGAVECHWSLALPDSADTPRWRRMAIRMCPYGVLDCGVKSMPDSPPLIIRGRRGLGQSGSIWRGLLDQSVSIRPMSAVARSGATRPNSTILTR
jgi:hypothetical protein